MTKIWVLLLAFCLAISFLCAGMEAGVLSLSRWRIRRQARAGRRRARMLQTFLDQPENFLWTIVVANTMAALAVFGLVAISGRRR